MHIEDIAYHIWEAGYLAGKADIEYRKAGYEGEPIESGPLCVAPYPQVCEWLAKIVWINEIGYC